LRWTATFTDTRASEPHEQDAVYGELCQPGTHRAAILVVDDEPAITALLAEVLDIAGYDTLTAADGRTALAIARREHPALVLTDRLMPEVDGIEFVRKLRASPVTNNIPVVLMSSTRPTQEQLSDIPFLPKPFDLDEVLSVIAKYASCASSASGAGTA
jgi:CheY-like chemotaxis protein